MLRTLKMHKYSPTTKVEKYTLTLSTELGGMLQRSLLQNLEMVL
jgi:hypothetical protein